VRKIRSVWQKFVVGGHVTVTVKAKGIRTRIRYPLRKKLKIILIINNQFTNAANATQIASGAGRSSAAGSNAAVASSNTEQQQSVGAGGTATNAGMAGTQTEPHRPRKLRGRRKHRNGRRRKKKNILIILNNQVNETREDSVSAATQIASGGKSFGASGTNSAIESANTKQQHGVGGGSGAEASNTGMNADQIER
jgi:hypothetical protein